MKSNEEGWAFQKYLAGRGSRITLVQSAYLIGRFVSDLLKQGPYQRPPKTHVSPGLLSRRSSRWLARNRRFLFALASSPGM